MKVFIRFIFFSFMLSNLYPASKKHFTDQQIANMIPNYFYREHNSPNIKRIRVYGKDNEKYLHIEIDVNRNRYQGRQILHCMLWRILLNMQKYLLISLLLLCIQLLNQKSLR